MVDQFVIEGAEWWNRLSGDERVIWLGYARDQAPEGASVAGAFRLFCRRRLADLDASIERLTRQELDWPLEQAVAEAHRIREMLGIPAD